MKTCKIKVYYRLVPDVAHKVYTVSYTLKTSVINAVAKINSKRPDILAVASF